MTTAIAVTESELVLDEVASKAVEEVARKVCEVAAGRLDEPEWIAAAREAWDDLPASVRRALRGFRRHSGPHGALLVRGLPVDGETLPPTPVVKGSVQRVATVQAAVLMLVASGLGDPAAYLAEKAGAMVQDVVPVPGQEEIQGNVGSTLLSLHTENAFHSHRPDIVQLLCLRADHEGAAGLRVACVREALPMLREETKEALHRPEYVTAAPPSFGGGGETEPHSILSGASDDPDLRVDFAATRATTDRAGVALAELETSLTAVEHTIRLVPGDLAIVDNRVTTHGRTAFRPRYDGGDRWVQRVFVLTDLRRSRHQRPSDGAVLVG